MELTSGFGNTGLSLLSRLRIGGDVSPFPSHYLMLFSGISVPLPHLLNPAYFD